MAEKRIISNPEAFPIQPEDIDDIRSFSCTFGNSETEDSALCIVRFCQQRQQSWNPIKLEELTRFYREWARKPEGEFCLYHLASPGISWGFGCALRNLEDGWILEQDEGATLLITEEFVQRCFKTAPAR